MERKFKVGKTTYQRSRKYGVGKEIGGKWYVHKDYGFNLIYYCRDAEELLPPGFKYNCLMVDRNRPYVIRFDEAPDFDTAREPHLGDFIEVNISTKEIRRGHSDFIWHHKWMWVDDDYTGFDVGESYEWSKRWTQFISHPSGLKKIWESQLSKITY